VHAPRAQRGTSDLEVLLVSMPFGPVFSPSLALSLLQALLARHGRRAHVRYFSIRFAEIVGQSLYSQIASDGRPSIRELAGEWIFSGALAPSSPRDDRRYLDEVLRGGGAWSDTRGRPPVSEKLIARILKARAAVESFLEECLEEVAAARPRLVGFTSIFQQHAASLALARRIKEACPGTVVVMGGANCEEVMGAETVRQYPFVDAVVSGEAEVVFPELVERALDGRALEGLPGVRTPTGVAAEFARGRFDTAPMVVDMDALPVPDFSDYFAQFEQSRFRSRWQPGLFFESSRGCWWGEKMHCTFCGLNGTTMAFRSKSAGRALRELEEITGRHPGCDVQVVDNILDLAYFKDFLPALARRGLDLDLFYETKSNLRKDQVRLLRQARVRTIQPGIESLSDSVLRLMKKGVTGLQNVQLLKWCRELGVHPSWNILWGFPGEDPAEYTRMAELVPLLTHLAAPVGCGDIRLDRFSPNFVEAERLGLTDLQPLAPYRHVYRGLPEEALRNLAYYFSFRYLEPREVAAYVAPLRRALRGWQRSAEGSALFSVDVGGRLLVWDLRPAARGPLHVLDGLERDLYLGCDAATDVRTLAARHGRGEAEVEDSLGSAVERKLMIRDGGRHLALAVALGDYAPAPEARRRFERAARGLGRRDGGRLRVALPRNGAPHVGASPPPPPRRGSPLSSAHFALDGRGDLLIRMASRERRT
jgi:ribosomal peptide maturation radical SAM protein 1